MTKGRRDPGGSSWWWDGGEGGEEGFQPAPTVAMSENEMAALEGYEQVAAARNLSESDILQLSYPRPRLRWTPELHDKFVKAVDELGGASKATPKAIWSLMGVRGLTLYHLKSHLQKFRLGKTGRRLWRKELIRSTYYPKTDDILAPINNESREISNAIHMNGSNAVGAEAYGNLHLLVEPQAAAEKFEMAGNVPALNTNEAEAEAAAAATTTATAEVKVEEELGTQNPPLLPLFPPCGMVNYSPEWSEYMEGVGGRRSVNASVDDYLNSNDFGLTRSQDSCRASMVFGSFFDEVATFSKVEDSDDAIQDDHDLSAGIAHYFP